MFFSGLIFVFSKFQFLIHWFLHINLSIANRSDESFNMDRRRIYYPFYHEEDATPSPPPNGVANAVAPLNNCRQATQPITASATSNGSNAPLTNTGYVVMPLGNTTGPEQQVIRKNDKPNDVVKTQKVAKMGPAPRAPKRGSNSNAHPPIFSQATTDAYSKKIRDLENLLAMQSGESKGTIERLQKENDEYREEVQRLNREQGNLAAQMEEIINQKDQELASKTLHIGKCHNYMAEKAMEYDSKMKEMKEKLGEAARIKEENDKRHREDQRKQEELQKKIDELMASQNVFYTLVIRLPLQVQSQKPLRELERNLRTRLQLDRNVN
ncbi:unnamed protein product [Caenorhabditis brenneri]